MKKGFQYYQTFVGSKINTWEVLKIQKNYKSKSPYFFVKCECGTEKWIICYDLIVREYRGCKDCYSANLQKKIGETYNQLTIIDYGQRKDKTHYYKCLCSCGNEKWILCSSVLTSHTKTCWNCPVNSYELDGEYAVGYTSSGQEFIFDKEDYDKIKDYTWCIDSLGYVNCGATRMHRLITNPPKGKVIDHINRCRTDNRKSNLRICTQHINSLNKELSTLNVSGKTGVYYDSTRNRWRVQLTKRGKVYSGGSYTDKEDAINKRIEMELEIYGHRVPS